MSQLHALRYHMNAGNTNIAMDRPCELSLCLVSLLALCALLLTLCSLLPLSRFPPLSLSISAAQQLECEQSMGCTGV